MIDPDIHSMLVDWARWCRSSYMPAEFHVLCQSAECKHLPEAGEVMMSLEERLKASQPAYNSLQAEKIEDIVSRLPDLSKVALRLHYVVWRAMPMKQKRRILGVSEEKYWQLVEYSALLTSHRLNSTKGTRPLIMGELFHVATTN